MLSRKLKSIAFSVDEFINFLIRNDISKILIAGCYTNICIKEAIRSGIKAEYTTYVSEEMVTSEHPDFPIFDMGNTFHTLVAEFSDYADFIIVCSPSRNTTLREKQPKRDDYSDPGCSHWQYYPSAFFGDKA